MNANEPMQGGELESGSTADERSLGRDALGLLLFGLAVLLGVSVFLWMTRPAEVPQGTTAFFTELVELLGAWPLLALSVALAVLGGRLWVAGVARGLARHMLGAGLTALALAFLAGAIFPGAGGAFGAWSGGTVTSELTIFAGVPAGLLALGLAIWLVWLRPADGSLPDAPPRFATLEGLSAESEGLSADEAAALLPSDPPADGTGGPSGWGGTLATPRPPVTGRSIPISPELPPLYPPDVRLTGGIPEGTQPLSGLSHEPASFQPVPAAGGFPASLDSRAGWIGRAGNEPLGRDEERAGAPQASTLRGAADAAGPVANRPAGADLAPSADLRPLWEQAEEASGLSEEEPPLPLDEGEELEESDEPALADSLAEGLVHEPEPEPELEPAEPTLARASWEQPGLFDEEPVDSYGTPLSLIEELRSAELAPVEKSDIPEPRRSEDVVEEPVAEVEILAQEDPQDLAASEEPPVVLTPRSKSKARATKRAARAQVASASEPAASSATDPEGAAASSDLVYRAGVLFLERGRVAVSLLQREFRLDFKQATALLDRLQQAGLIGPYLGGQRRDILLSLEEWRERVGVS